MSVIGDFYSELAARLLLIKDENDISIIKHIDFWNQQYNDDYKEVFDHPAVFLEFKQMPSRSTGKHKQIAELHFDLHIASSTKAKSKYDSQFTSRFLQQFELLDLIHYWLSGFNGTFFGSISRTNTSVDQYYKDITKHVQSYRCVVTDVSAMRTFTKVEGDKLVVKLVDL